MTTLILILGIFCATPVVLEIGYRLAMPILRRLVR